jgi:hypothetical protein
MEYFVGAAITMMVYVVANRIIKKESQKDEDILKITYSQSHIYELMAPYLDLAPPPEEFQPRQSSQFLKNSYIKIMIVKNKAYWIKDNTFYVADVVGGQVVKEGAKKVDTMAMSKVELNEMLFIIEKLREDGNDNWSTGKQ